MEIQISSRHRSGRQLMEIQISCGHRSGRQMMEIQMSGRQLTAR